MYIQSYLQPSSGQVGALVETAGVVQRVNPAALQSVMAILQNRKVVQLGSGSKDNPTVILPGQIADAPYWAYNVTQDPASGFESAYGMIALSEQSSPGWTVLIDVTALQKQLDTGKNVDIGLLMTKDQSIVKLFASPGGSLAVLQSPTSQADGKKKEGIATMTIVGGLAAGVVGTLIGGPVTGVAAGAGTAALLHYAA